MKVEIWSDIACPWCYIGKRRFEQALEQFPHKDQVEVTWRSFQLDPTAPRQSDLTMNDALSKKFGMSAAQVAQMDAHMTGLAAAEGLDFRFDRIKSANSFDGHRLIHFAAKHGKQDAMKERLMHDYWSEGLALWDTDALVKAATDIGLDADEARATLESDSYSDEVQADIQQAQDYGITGVPFFAIDETYGISGAQPAETFKAALTQAWTASHPLVKIGETSPGAGTCEGDSCAI